MQTNIFFGQLPKINLQDLGFPSSLSTMALYNQSSRFYVLFRTHFFGSSRPFCTSFPCEFPARSNSFSLILQLLKALIANSKS